MEYERGHKAALAITHSTEFLNNNDPLFWYSCFVRLFPRGDCRERGQRSSTLPSGRWAKCLLTRADFPLWRLDVEFVASLYNIFLRRAQVGAVEMSIRSSRLTASNLEDIQQITAGLLARRENSGGVNSFRDLLRKKKLEIPIHRAFMQMDLIQRDVWGSDSEKDGILPKFMGLR